MNAPVTERPKGTVFQIVPRHEEMTFLPEPEPRESRFPLISVDDHIIETPDVFVSRVPARLRERVPHVQQENGIPIWRIGRHRQPIVAGNALSGRPASEWHFYDALRYEEMRKGAWDAAAFVRDMDVNGTVASLGFPSSVFGFAGQMFFELKDEEAAVAAIDARNDWILEEWYEPFPDRFIPMQIVWMGDAAVAAAQIRKNAERGFRAVSFSECPERLGLPLHTQRVLGAVLRRLRRDRYRHQPAHRLVLLHRGGFEGGLGHQLPVLPPERHDLSWGLALLAGHHQVPGP
jgi:hypothetical protein